MTDLINSKLWKSTLLSENSTHFPRLVRAAAFQAGKPYTEHMMQSVASDPTLLDSFPIEAGEGIDAILATIAIASGEAMDTVILAAVERYTPPADTSGPPG